MKKVPRYEVLEEYEPMGAPEPMNRLEYALQKRLWEVLHESMPQIWPATEEMGQSSFALESAEALLFDGFLVDQPDPTDRRVLISSVELPFLAKAVKLAYQPLPKLIKAIQRTGGMELPREDFGRTLETRQMQWATIYALGRTITCEALNRFFRAPRYQVFIGDEVVLPKATVNKPKPITPDVLMSCVEVISEGQWPGSMRVCPFTSD